MELHISVVNKIATYRNRDGSIVCGNSDYTIRFNLDSEWDDISDKTARFIWDGDRAEVPIVDGVCAVPVLNDTTAVIVGVHGGDAFASTPVLINCVPSILCSTPSTS